MYKKDLNFIHVILLLLIGLHILIMLQLRFFPYTEMFIYSYLTSHGLIPYQDIFDQHFPGLMMLPVNFYSLGINTVRDFRIVHLLLIIVNHILIYITSKKLLRSSRKALLVNILYLIWQPYYEGFVLWIDSFIPCLLLSTYYLMLKWLEKNKRKFLYVIGFLLSIGIVFKQVVIPFSVLIFLYIYIQRNRMQDVVDIVIGMAPILILLNLYILYVGAWYEFFYWTYTFNMTVFAEMGLSRPTLITLLKASPVFLTSILAAVFYFLYRDFNKKILLLVIFFLGSLVFAYARFDFIHLQPALPFALILLVVAFISLDRYKTVVFIFYLLISFVPLISMYRYLYKPGDTTAFTEKEFEMFNAVREYVDPLDKIFVLGGPPHTYVYTDTLPAGNKFVFQFPWFMKVAETEILAGLEKDRPKIVVRLSEMALNEENYMNRIHSFIDNNYMVIEKVNRFEIMRSK